jgi:hypothetical protein
MRVHRARRAEETHAAEVTRSTRAHGDTAIGSDRADAGESDRYVAEPRPSSNTEFPPVPAYRVVPEG